MSTGNSGLFHNTKGAKEHQVAYKPFYSEYVRHALRFYTRNMDVSTFKSEADKRNWQACASVIKTYSERDRDIIVAVFGNRDTLADNVYEAAKQRNINQGIIWDMLKELERKIAKRRGLI